MNKKSKELDMKLENCKIISEGVMKSISNTKYFDEQSKKQEELKLFSDEFKKVQI